MSILFWQKPQWEQALFLHTQNRLPHALLLSGIKGLGKKQFAHYFGRWLLCESLDKVKTQAPCQKCQSCQWMINDAHPEWFTIAPVENASISIDQIREVMPWMQLTPQYATHKWVFIEEVDKLSLAASHALLKILEEPSSSTRFILVSSYKHRLQATILSRSTLLEFNPPCESEVQTSFKDIPLWALRMAQGAPIAAQAFASPAFEKNRLQWIQELRGVADKVKDPIEVAQGWIKTNQNNALYLFYYWLIDLISILMSAKESDSLRVINIDQVSYLRVLAKKCCSSTVLALITKLEKMLKMKSQVSAGNDQLCFETLLIHYSQLME